MKCQQNFTNALARWPTDGPGVGCQGSGHIEQWLEQDDRTYGASLEPFARVHRGLDLTVHFRARSSHNLFVLLSPTRWGLLSCTYFSCFYFRVEEGAEEQNLAPRWVVFFSFNHRLRGTNSTANLH